MRPPCTDKDYFYTHTACDANGEVRTPPVTSSPGPVPCARVPARCSSPRVPAQTQLMFKWAEPKICSEALPRAAQLPPSGLKTRCPPCNPGFYKSNSSACEPCPYGSYSNGSGKEDPGGGGCALSSHGCLP